MDAIREYFSVKNKEARFSNNRFTPERKYAISKTGRFNLGMYREIMKHIRANTYHDSDVIKDEKIFDKIYPRYKIDKIYDDVLLHTPRDDQSEVLKMCLNVGRGVCLCGTGFGKTFLFSLLLENLFRQYGSKFKALVIVPDLGLVEQTYDDMVEYNTTYTKSRWSGDHHLCIDSNVIVVNADQLRSKNFDKKLYGKFDTILIDECHSLKKDNNITDIVNKFTTLNRFGFTGTLPEEILDKWTLLGVVGPLLYNKGTFELRKEGVLTQAEIKIIDIYYRNPIHVDKNANPASEFLREREFIIRNDFRNKVISKIVNKLSKNTLILVDYIEHGEIIKEYLERYCPNKKVYFICGDVETAERNRIRVLMENSDDIVAVAISKIFSTGINIKNLHYLIFANGGKAKVRTIQSIGRGLRKHASKSKFIIFDIADKLHFSIKQIEKRISLYTKEKIKYGRKQIRES